MCDYCPRVMHLKRCAGLIANYKGEYKCPKCEENGNHVKTEEGKKYWGKITNKITRTREMEGLTITIEEFLKIAPAKIKEDEIIKIPNDSSKQFNPKTVNSITVTPEWSIKPRQIYETQKIKSI